MPRVTKAQLQERVEELEKQVEKYHLAYDNIIIIQDSITKAIKEIKKQKRAAKKNEEELEVAKWDGYLQCLYRMSSWVNMTAKKKDK